MLKLKGTVEEIQRIAGELCFEWRVDNFFSLSRLDYFNSPVISFHGYFWVMTVFPNSEGLDLHLFREDEGSPVIIKIAVAVRGSKGEEHKKEWKGEFSQHGRWQVWDHDSAPEMKYVRRELLQDGALVLRCEMKVDTGDACTQTSFETVDEVVESSEKRDVCTQTSFETVNKVLESSEKIGGEKALEDFGNLLASGERSDVTLQAGDVEFKVHSAILIARSPALSISLHHESKEKASSKIVIEDCDPDILRDFLRYVYTGSVESLTPQNVFGLFSIADKYLAEDLKSKCLEHVRNTLCVQTFCDAVKLALRHREEALFRQALGFASKNIQAILISVEWQKFICECAIQANEILIKCFNRRN